MAFLNVEDLIGNVEVVVFPQVYERYSTLLVEDAKVFIRGRVSLEEDKDGKLITESLTDYTRRNLLAQFVTLNDFLSAWNTATRKQAILDELEAQGVLIDELQDQIGQEFDPFDLLCHVAYDMPPLTRRERANNVQKRHYFAKYGEQAAAVLEALLEKYADSGISSLENLDVLKVVPRPPRDSKTSCALTPESMAMRNILSKSPGCCSSKPLTSKSRSGN